MRKILILLMGFLLSACGSEKQNNANNGRILKEDKKGLKSKLQILNVYNMGGVPTKDMDELIEALQKVYPATKYAGKLDLLESCYIKNDPKGKNRYWWSKLLPYLINTTDVKHGLTLAIVNAEVCNWDAEKKGSHANLGLSNLGGHVSTISYQRLKVNNLNNVNDMMKVVIHELGHSLGGLVPNRKDDGGHCPNKNCLMKNANNRFPYRGLNSLCPSCSKVMKDKGFNINKLELKSYD